MNQRGFTLIELLVVIAIIGILSAIVVSSLDTSRNKGSIASIKADLRNAIPQAELSYDGASPNSFVNACAAVAPMIAGIASAGGTAVCYSYDNTRFGVSAKLNADTTKNYSADSAGVVTWDTADQSGALTWDAANTACAAAGGRLPSFEELKALDLIYGSTPPSFAVHQYWSGTLDPTTSANAYYVSVDNGGYGSIARTSTIYVRCVHNV